jgi:hypothetical protein
MELARDVRGTESHIGLRVLDFSDRAFKMLPVVGSQTMNELETLIVTNAATDAYPLDALNLSSILLRPFCLIVMPSTPITLSDAPWCFLPSSARPPRNRRLGR